jgi:hypothetical protein
MASLATGTGKENWPNAAVCWECRLPIRTALERNRPAITATFIIHEAG